MTIPLTNILALSGVALLSCFSLFAISEPLDVARNLRLTTDSEIPVSINQTNYCRDPEILSRPFDPRPIRLSPSECATSPIPVFRLPQGYVRNEAGHFLRDGLVKSECFVETGMFTADLWIYDRDAIGEDCKEFDQIIRQRLKKSCGTAKGCSLPNWKIIQIEYIDFFHKYRPCGLDLVEKKVIPSENLIWYRRSTVGNRTSLMEKWGRVINYTERFNGTIIRHIPYGVRSDCVLEVHKYLVERYNLTLPTTKTPINPVFLDRPGDVRFFWFPLKRNCRGECQASKTRFEVSKVLLDMNTTKLNILVGNAGRTNSFGRRFASMEYVREMLKYKILIVAQRDEHEDMYRLMESFVGGGLVMCDAMVAPPKYLVDGEHYVVYYSLDDLRRKIFYYLNECPAERLRIANQGWNLVMQKYRSFHLMEQVILNQTVDI